MANDNLNISIENRQSLDVAISRLRTRICEREDRLAAQLVFLPGEALKKLLKTITFAFLAKKIAGSGFGIIKQLLRLVFKSKQKNREEHTKEALIKNTKTFSVFTAITALFKKFTGQTNKK
ncbi:MAG: hypothetical protein JWN76_513 [Chitinophagaceae bacterium]|nr:hypothetical protein [Chitinophagaceae bacterium]